MVKGQATPSQKILILTAIPHGLRLDKEIREIEDAIRRATRRDLFDIRTRTAVRPQDIRRAIAEEKPQIVHFCGHGLEDGSLLLEDEGGQNKAIPPEGLASLFKLHADYVDCVLLNACHSVKSAEAISKYIHYTIGMNQEIQDQSAIQFAQGFYDGLGYETSENQNKFQRAFQEGLVAIKLENLSQAQIPVIKTRINIDKPHKPMDISLLVKFLVPCLPFLMNVGNKAVEGASQKLGQDTWNKAKAIWTKLCPKVEAEAAANIAATKLAEKPDSEVWKAALKEELEALFQKDHELAEFIAEILKDKDGVSKGGIQIQQTAGTVEGQMIGQMQNSEAKNIGSIGSVQGDVKL